MGCEITLCQKKVEENVWSISGCVSNNNYIWRCGLIHGTERNQGLKPGTE